MSKSPLASAVINEKVGGSSGQTPKRRLLLSLVVVAFVMITAVAGVSMYLLVTTPSSADLRPVVSVLSERVEERVLSASLVTRGEVVSAGSESVSCRPGAEGKAEVFTRELVMGDVLAEGDVLAGVNGRPVLLMVGKTPAFRDMLPGSSGVDVRQLQAGLKRLGFSSSTSGVLDKATQAGLRSWYQSKGFQAKEPTTEEASALRAAREGVASARSTVAAAERALTEARKGASESEVLQAELSVDSAKQAYLEAAAGEKAAAAKQLKIAKLALAEVKKKPVIDAEKAAVSDAKAALKRAKEEVSELETATGVSVPFCEVVFVPSLPATVVENPQTNPDGESQDAGGVWATLATGKLSLQATLDPTDAALVKEGAKVLFREDSAGEDQEGRVEKIVDADAGPTLVVATDGGFSEEQRGASMRVSVELESTAGAVLVVPTVALSGQADGRAVVEKLVDGQPSQVRVKAGLVADGYVEVQVLEGQLEAGDEVVTGR